MYEKLCDRVMNMLLAGDLEVLKILKKQYAKSKIISIEETGKGIFVEFETSEEPLPNSNKIKQDFVFGDVNGIVDEIIGAVGFILFVRDGYIVTLEGYSNVPGSWEKVNENLNLIYMPEKRDLKKIEKSWINS